MLNGNGNGHAAPALWDLVVPQRVSETAHAFRFVSGHTPFGRFSDAVAACIVYFALVRVLRAAMQGRKAPELRPLIVAHNFVLTLASTALFTCFGLVLAEKAARHSLFDMICSEEMHDDGRLHTLYYINYLVKWYELADTMFLVLRKREVIFLHEYHHAATLWLCWIQMDQHSTVQWVPITINLLVHMFMYYYYMLSALKIQVWWKKYLTQLQIVQFVIDIAACVYASTHEPVLGDLGLAGAYERAFGFKPARCNGTLAGALSGVGIIFSYLVLFVFFYFNTYSAGKAARRGRAKKTD